MSSLPVPPVPDLARVGGSTVAHLVVGRARSLCMVATIHKRFLLDTEFFGQRCEIEYVDLAADAVSKDRVVTRHSLASLELWSEERLRDRLSLVSEAFERVRASGLVRPKQRVARRPDKDMNLFD
jgi:hypothetical protein